MFARFEAYPSSNPLVADLFGVSGHIDSLLENAFGAVPADESVFAPPVDVAENNEAVVVVAEIPGVKKEDVRISLEKGILSISGERKPGEPSAESRGLVKEQRWGKFSRTVRLHSDVDAGKVSAELNDGLLKVILPKAESMKAHEIRVR